MNKRVFATFLFILFFAATFAFGQNIVITPDKENWLYTTQEEAVFKIEVFNDGKLMKNAVINYELGPEYFPTDKKENVTLPDGQLTLRSKMDIPGFLRCRVTININGRSIYSLATVGYEPEKIEPTSIDPADFDDFWENAIAEARKTPLDPKLTLLENLSTPTKNVYEVSFQNDRADSRIYGILSIPKGGKKYPALLSVPGAGIRPYSGYNQGDEVITLQIGIHGIPVTLEQEVYNNLNRGALRDYQSINKNDRDAHYYKRVYVGCVRAVDYIFTLPEFDGSTIGVTGGSQGGALSIITAALDNRIKFLAAFYPALCDPNGYLNGRAGGWPHYFRSASPKPNEVETLSYYDVVNFAKRLDVPGWYSWGFNDTTCPPTSMYAAYNTITAPKELDIYKETGHRTIPVQTKANEKWLADKCAELSKK